jgi:hypothetical protein
MPELAPEEQIEVEADRRRRVNAAFRLGSEATPAAPGPSWLGPMLAGIALALAAALVLGVITLARATPATTQATPSVRTSPTR